MLLFEFLRVGWTVLTMHKFRSALTLVSIAIGTFSIVMMSSLAESGTTTLLRGVESIGGARVVLVVPKDPEKAEKKRSSYTRGVILDDVEALRGRIPHVERVTMMTVLGDRDFRTETNRPMRADLAAGNEDFLGAFGMKLVAGRNIDAQDLIGGRRLAVLGHGVAKTLFASPEAALGQMIRGGNDSFRVVGVIAEVKRFGARFGFDWNDFIMVPLTAFGPRVQGLVMMLTDSSEHNDIAKRIAAVILKDRHHGVDDFEIIDFATLMEKMEAVFSVMHLIAGLIAGVALLAGGIGVMNILLVSVSERVREIGVRKALGAPDRAIGLQFLFESALLSGLGGLLGVALGCAGVVASGPLIRMKAEAWVAVISIGASTGALIASLLIGIFFGLVPARKASRLLVVDCLRANG
jgi:putative ABC transport system permease protein